jgi:HNH endonuclease
VGLRRAASVEVRSAGVGFFRRLIVRASAEAVFIHRGGSLQRLLAEHEHGAALVGERGGWRLWWIGDAYYWDDEALTAEHVALEVWDRERRRDHRFERLRSIRAREEVAAAASRERIAPEVRRFVWDRDGGRCVTCGAEEDLQFDHVIPVARGGGNAVANIQILCGSCNRQKSDGIA